MISLPQAETPTVSIVTLAYQDAPGLRSCLAALSTRLPANVPSETIVVANGARAEVVEILDGEVRGARIVRSSVNRGFGGGCNLGAAHARGEFLMFLNDDAIVQPGWLDPLLETMARHPEAGAVGSKLVTSGGRIVEAGQVVWSDGTSVGLGVGTRADDERYSFVRPVDYCSAAALLVRRSTWEAVGGMDEDYFPAYYEDVDLCFAIAGAGQSVLVDPRSVVEHEWGARPASHYAVFLMNRNRHRLLDKWSARLQEHEPPQSDSPTALDRAALRPRGAPRRLLLVDDCFPTAVGAGYGRMLELLDQLEGHNYAISVFARSPGPEDRASLRTRGIEIVAEKLAGHLRRPERRYDMIVISRPSRISEEIELIRAHQPQATVVYDCEALVHRQVEGRLAFASDSREVARLAEQLERLREVEERIAVHVDRIVCVTEEEAGFLRAVPGSCPVDVIPATSSQSRWTKRRFRERHNALFVASWLAAGEPGSPNEVALQWFATEVVPHIRADAPWLRVYVTGAHPPEAVRALESLNVRLLGHVTDLHALYDRSRAVIVPNQFGAGVKVKALEALQHGVPVLATTAGAAGSGLELMVELAPVDDPREFASRLIALTNDEAAWERARAEVRTLLDDWSAVRSPSWLSVLSSAQREAA